MVVGATGGDAPDVEAVGEASSGDAERGDTEVEAPSGPMGERTSLGLALLGAAAVLGIAADGLLRAAPWGINVGLWAASIALAVVGVARWRRVPLATGGLLLVPMVLFAFGVAWRASPVLLACNVLAALLCLGLLGAYGRHGSLLRTGFLDMAIGLTVAGLHAAVGVFVLAFGDVRWVQIPREGWARHVLAVGRGLAVAVPLVLVFGGLFVAADAVFEGLVRDYLQIDLGALVGQLFVATVVAWIAAGWLRYVFVTAPVRVPAELRPAFFTLGSIELGIIFGLLNLLFLTFVAVQFRYLFGGAPVVEASATLTYAEYARRGFFELNAVAALLLPIMLFAEWAARKETAREVRVFRVLAGLLVVLLFVVVVSALQRMRLYTDEFGLTELRLYTTAFMAWITLMFGWFLATVLRGRRERFMLGALVAGLAILAGLNALNPDGTIVAVNAERQARATLAKRSGIGVDGEPPIGIPHVRRSARDFDGEYVLKLSADSVPAVVESLPTMTEADRTRTAASLLRRWSALETRDWRTWNWGRETAWRTIEGNRAMLTALAG